MTQPSSFDAGARILRIAPGSIVVTVGSAGAGKTGWVRRNFGAEQILSLDHFRTLLAGAETAYGATAEALPLLVATLAGRARRGLTTAVDGTFTDPEIRRRLVAVAREHRRPAVAVVFRVPEELAQFRNRSGAKYTPGALIRRQLHEAERFLATGADEGWSAIVPLDAADPDLLPAVRFTPPAALPHAGPFDVIGDVHGCLAELDELLDRLGWSPPDGDGVRRHPDGRMAAFVGDYGDRGPDSAGVFRRVIAMHRAGTALGVPGNHCVKLLKALNGRPVRVGNGLELTLAQLRAAGPALEREVHGFLSSLPPVLPLAGGRLVVFHAALPREQVERIDDATRAHTAYGVVRGTDAEGYPLRDLGWTAGWKTGEDEPLAVFGHTPVAEPERRDNTVDIDGGCVFGGYLAALRFPELALVCVPARAVYYPSPRVWWRGTPGGAGEHGRAWERRTAAT